MSTSFSMSSERPINSKATTRASWARARIKPWVEKLPVILSICKSILLLDLEMRLCRLGAPIRWIAMRACPTFPLRWRITSQPSRAALHFHKVRARSNLPSIRRENRWPGCLGQYTRGYCSATSRHWVGPRALGSLQRAKWMYLRFKFNNQDLLLCKAPFQNSKAAARGASQAADAALKSEQARLS